MIKSKRTSNIYAIYTRNWSTLVGLFCVVYIWACIFSAFFTNQYITVAPGKWGYIGVCVGIAAAAIIFGYLLLAHQKKLLIKCELILPSFCATLLVVSRFFFSWQDDISLFAANIILGFSTLTILVLAFLGIKNETYAGIPQVVTIVIIILIYISYFIIIFISWPFVGDILANQIGQALLVFFLFSVSFNMFLRMQRIEPSDADIESAKEKPISIENITMKYKLSPREAEVLLLLAQGYSAPFIADKFFISIGTVKTHIKRIYMKCGVSKRDELIKLLHL